jgi:hypothetical protein
MWATQREVRRFRFGKRRSDRSRIGYEPGVRGDSGRPIPDVAFNFHDVMAPRRARLALQGLFAHHDPVADAVSLVASELVSNVIRHTDDGGHLEAWNGKPFRLEVHDTDPTLAASPEHADQYGGHGLRIVDEVADDWGIRLDEGGKTLWAEIGGRSPIRPPPTSRQSKPWVTPGDHQQSDGLHPPSRHDR